MEYDNEKTKNPKNEKTKKFIKLLFYGFLVFSIYGLLVIVSYDSSRKPILGVTYSKQFTQYLGLDWQKAYLATLDELKVKHIRLPIYWEEVEPVNDQYIFSDIDWMVQEAAKRNVKLVMVVGMRQPRWPECHFPEWIKDLNKEVRSIEVLQIVQKSVEHFKNYSNIEYWQVENEPLLEFFGECPRPDRQLIKNEINLVRSLDKRPVVITASGELSFWYPEALWGDIIGSTLYRTTWNKYIGYWNYFFIPPSFYRVKAFLLGKSAQDYWVAELQGEPWFPGDPLAATLEEQYKTMNPQILKNNIDYAIKVNPGRIYLWGVEWWYYTQEKFGDPQMWEAAKKIRW